VLGGLGGTAIGEGETVSTGEGLGDGLMAACTHQVKQSGQVVDGDDAY
jgi:hypothetical protein